MEQTIVKNTNGVNDSTKTNGVNDSTKTVLRIDKKSEFLGKIGIGKTNWHLYRTNGMLSCLVTALANGKEIDASITKHPEVKELVSQIKDQIDSIFYLPKSSVIRAVKSNFSNYEELIFIADNDIDSKDRPIFDPNSKEKDQYIELTRGNQDAQKSLASYLVSCGAMSKQQKKELENQISTNEKLLVEINKKLSFRTNERKDDRNQKTFISLSKRIDQAGKNYNYGSLMELGQKVNDSILKTTQKTTLLERVRVLTG